MKHLFEHLLESEPAQDLADVALEKRYVKLLSKYQVLKDLQDEMYRLMANMNRVVTIMNPKKFGVDNISRIFAKDRFDSYIIRVEKTYTDGSNIELIHEFNIHYMLSDLSYEIDYRGSRLGRKTSYMPKEAAISALEDSGVKIDIDNVMKKFALEFQKLLSNIDEVRELNKIRDDMKHCRQKSLQK